MRRTVILLLLCATVLGMTRLRQHWVSSPNNLQIVEDETIYRSGFLDQKALPRILDELQIRTVIRLAPADSHPAFSREAEILQERGITLYQKTLDNLTGPQLIRILNETADIMADESHQPVLVHCKRGIDRTGSAVSVFRMRQQGWKPALVHRELLDKGVPLHRWPHAFVDQYWDVRTRRMHLNGN